MYLENETVQYDCVLQYKLKYVRGSCIIINTVADRSTMREYVCCCTSSSSLLFLFHLIGVEKDDQYDNHKACVYMCQHILYYCKVSDRSDKKERKRMKERVSSICQRKFTHLTREREMDNYNFTFLSYCYQ
jgi:hypothetical protein